MNNDLLNQGLMEFLQQSPTPFHAVDVMSKKLESSGYMKLNEADQWFTEPGGHYYVTRNDSSIIAFTLTIENLAETGFNLVGAHTDSPCLKLKPNALTGNKGYCQLGVEVYGGALLNPWFDRDLSIAGRVTFRDSIGTISSALIDFHEPTATIPSLAIHLDKDVNNNRSINAQTHLPPVWFLSDEPDEQDFTALLEQQLQKQHPDILFERVLDHELHLYDVQPPAKTGLLGEFISSARLDNLVSCYIGLQSLLDAGQDTPSLLVCNDHEEIGSASASGAQGPFLKSVLERLSENREDLTRTIDRSIMISCDNAHAIHPNFSDKHDGHHGPLLNKGPVIKTNANQRYATNSETSAIFRNLCESAGVPVQQFVTRADMGCGSTIGPITATEIGVKTIDVGVPQLAMHSVREMCGSKDPYYLYQVLCEFYGSANV